MTSMEKLKNAVKENETNLPAQTSAAAPPADQKTAGNTIFDLINKMAPAISKALPKHLNLERFMRVALTSVRLNPALASCNRESFLAALMQSAQLGLEPSTLGHAYLIPYKKECKFIIGYQGLLNLVRRSGQIKDIYSEIIYDQDEFQIEFGLDRKLIHRPAFEKADRGKPKFVYAVAKIADGTTTFVVLSMAEVNKIKGASQSAGSSFSPWQTWPEEMMKKTALKRLCKYLPISVEEAAALQQDETVKHEIAEDMILVPAVEETPEKEEQAA